MSYNDFLHRMLKHMQSKKLDYDDCVRYASAISQVFDFTGYPEFTGLDKRQREEKAYADLVSLIEDI